MKNLPLVSRKDFTVHGCVALAFDFKEGPSSGVDTILQHPDPVLSGKPNQSIPFLDARFLATVPTVACPEALVGANIVNPVVTTGVSCFCDK